MLGALWHLLAVHGVPLLVAIYFATTACLITLAVHVHYVGKRLKEVVRTTREQAVLIAELADLRAKPSDDPAAEAPAGNGRELPDPALRTALEALVAEMTSDIEADEPDYAIARAELTQALQDL